MVMQNNALICALEVLINSQYSCNTHASKQRIKSSSRSSENLSSCTSVLYIP